MIQSKSVLTVSCGIPTNNGKSDLKYFRTFGVQEGKRLAKRATETAATETATVAGTNCHKYLFSGSFLYILYYSVKARLEILLVSGRASFKGRNKRVRATEKRTDSSFKGKT
eukprot:jgi/Psemu1/53194/gm1.53194_g